jgi:outer membrane protein insertion porin family
MNKRWLALLAAGFLTHFSPSLMAVEDFVVEEIRIEGLQRITEGTVYNYLPIQIGSFVEEGKTAEILQSLFETGFFQDIDLVREGNTLVIKVVERPTIGKITLTGNKDLPTDNLLKTLKSAGLAEGYVFDRSTLEQVRNELERVYFSRGKYGVKVDTVVEVRDHNRVNVSITIVEGNAARIKAINIVGNHCFSNGVLLKSFTLAPTDVLSWVFQSDQYDKQKLSADLETLRTFYLDRGYLNFRILSTQVSITPDKQDIYITINVQEGEQFTLTGYSLGGEIVIPAEDLEKLITLNCGEIFSRGKVANIVKAMTDRLGEAGYAFAKINPVPDLDEENKTVRLGFYVEPGHKIYVRRIYFEGNTKTKDEAIRRELIQAEAAPVNTKSIEESKTRLNRTGYFSDVKVEMKPVPGTTDQVDVVYAVEEASAGQLGGGVGYSDLDGFLINANVTNRNFLGTGNSIDLNFNNSKAYTTYNFAYNNPYYTPEGVSRGFNIFYSETDLGEVTGITNYTTNVFGANISYGVPVSPYDRFTYGYGYQDTHLGYFPDSSPQEIVDFVNQNGTNSQEVTVALGWLHNTFNRMVFPEKGLQLSAGAMASVPGSHLQYYRLSANGQWFYPLGRGFIYTLGGTLGFGGGYGDTSELPFYKNFYCGGVRTVRGFKESSLGPRDSLGNPFGGNLLATATSGVILPNFFSEDLKSVRLTWFIDAGQVYTTQGTSIITDDPTGISSQHLEGFRYSTGLSLNWMSPIAPLVFNIAYPINKQINDKTQTFSFTFGTTF